MLKNVLLSLFSMSLLSLGGCGATQIQPTNMAIEYQFLESSDEIYSACGRRSAEACARVVGNTCLITLPKTYWQRHLVHEMKHCFGGHDAPTIAMSGW
jgi:hypothetical protein